jgi:hypothetical protein
MRPALFGMLAIATGIVVYAGTWLMALAGWFAMPSMALIILTLGIFITTSVYAVLHRTQEPTLFTNLYLLTIGLKLMLFGVVLFVIRFLAVADLPANAIFLMALYVALTAIEVAVLFKRVNNQQKPEIKE